jgi:hypothetical protein
MVTVTAGILDAAGAVTTMDGVTATAGVAGIERTPSLKSGGRLIGGFFRFG